MGQFCFRQSETFDGEDEEQEPSDKSESVLPAAIEGNSQLPAEPPSEISAEPVPSHEPDEHDAVPECSAEVPSVPEEKEAPHVEVESESAVESKTEHPPVAVEPKRDQVEEEIVKEEAGTEEPQKPAHETAEKTEEIFVTEIDDTESTDGIEELVEPVIVSEPFVDEKLDEEDQVQQEEKVDLKRKIDDAIEEEEDVVPSKKLTESPPERNLSDEEKPLEAETEIPAEVEVDETVTEIVEVTEVEGAMDSDVGGDVEEKVEMVVEEPEQAMEVDENSAQSAQSPMAQEDVAEPMEESELVTS